MIRYDYCSAASMHCSINLLIFVQKKSWVHGVHYEDWLDPCMRSYVGPNIRCAPDTTSSLMHSLGRPDLLYINDLTEARNACSYIPKPIMHTSSALILHSFILIHGRKNYSQGGNPCRAYHLVHVDTPTYTTFHANSSVSRSCMHINTLDYLSIVVSFSTST
jgi:hypothetical protein